ncbi:hypothetical protein C8J57DRAFT_225488 [Mycena rebaudengoi]|nr:hypothetical protein C8J57DRAFT_225488 [Mycena rebaudengoi]
MRTGIKGQCFHVLFCTSCAALPSLWLTLFFSSSSSQLALKHEPLFFFKMHFLKFVVTLAAVVSFTSAAPISNNRERDILLVRQARRDAVLHLVAARGLSARDISSLQHRYARAEGEDSGNHNGTCVTSLLNWVLGEITGHISAGIAVGNDTANITQGVQNDPIDMCLDEVLGWAVPKLFSSFAGGLNGTSTDAPGQGFAVEEQDGGGRNGTCVTSVLNWVLGEITGQNSAGANETAAAEASLSVNATQDAQNDPVQMCMDEALGWAVPKLFELFAGDLNGTSVDAPDAVPATDPSSKAVTDLSIKAHQRTGSASALPWRKSGGLATLAPLLMLAAALAG